MTLASPSDLENDVRQALARVPDWLRRDLLADDREARGRAEETLAAMIAAALKPKD